MYKADITKHLEWEFQNEIAKAIKLVNNYWLNKINHPFGYVEWETFRFNQSVKLSKPMSEEVFREMLLVNMGIKAIIRLIYEIKESELIKLQNANKILNTTLFTKTYSKMLDEIKKIMKEDKK
ncbi:hypothetical protein [Mycoplasmopsis opalescens]|uniref:hypothetical protein n=1 Tax=Mycoplasmopsis opalescens TaxID=114886 RepID=UPI0004A70E99|nr:hypothetical protein [Mycoplasmopsis opalescens]